MSSSRSSIITLTTDFQEGSPYIAQMKGVLLTHVPGVQIVDVTHSIPPQNIRFGAFVLAGTVPYFPEGTIHIAVVDPGVGSERELLCLQLEIPLREKFLHQTVLCPNNGLATILAQKFIIQNIVSIDLQGFSSTGISATFHGRDVLAPVAAQLLNGEKPETFGNQRNPESILTLEIPQPQYSAEGIRGEILFVDSFGNLITNIDRQFVQNLEKSEGILSGNLTANHHTFSFQRTYSDSQPGTLVVLFGSQGFLELAVVNGSAARKTGLKPGDGVFIPAR